jgi:hypothetical protein
MANMLPSIKRRCRYIIARSENGTGVGGRFVQRLRNDVLRRLSQESFRYLEQHLDARDHAWRVSNAFSFEQLAKRGV